MKTLVVTPHSEEDIEKLVKLLKDMELVDDVRIEEEKPPFRKLTTKDMALGIGRPATNEELRDYFERHKETTFYDMDDAFDIALGKKKREDIK